jgi:lysophospholipase L1-like esterase
VSSVALTAGILTVVYLRYRNDLHIRQTVKSFIYSVQSVGARRRVLLVGDSRINTLRCNLAQPGASVLNLGVAGLTADQLRANLDRWLGKSKQFDYAVIWIGVNDIIHHGSKPETVAKEIGWIATNLKDHASHVAVIGQIPIFGDVSGDSLRLANERLNRLQDEIDAYLAKVNYHSKKVSVLKVPIKVEGGRMRELYSDAVHLSNEGNKIVCETVLTWVGST